jgi:hypothetical protein
MQHTTETPKQYQCRHIFTDGRRCASPCLRQEEFCYYHHTTRKPIANPKQRRSRRATFHLPLPEDRSAIQSSIGEVLQRIASNDIDPRRAGLLLYGLQIASLNLPKIQSATKAAEPQTVEEITIDPTLGILAPRAEVSEITKPKSAVAQLIESMLQSEEEEEATPPKPTTIPTLQATEDNPIVTCPTPPNPQNRHFDRKRRTCRRSGEIRFSTSALTQPHQAFAVACCSSTQPPKPSFRPEEAHLPPQRRNPLLHLSSHTTASSLTLSRESGIPCPPEHRACKQS